MKHTFLDLFAGAGGTGTALEASGIVQHGDTWIAINHDRAACDTYHRNHPQVFPICQDVATVRFRDLIPDGIVDLMIAAPTCTHHSDALGDRPRDDLLRSQATHIIEAVNALYVKLLLVENVKEFMRWGPVDAKGRPIKKLQGTQFHAWLKLLRASHYHLCYAVLNCADYGDYTTRKRFFLLAVRKDLGHIPKMPAATHYENYSEMDSLFDLHPWKRFRDLYDPHAPTTSVFYRPKVLVENTLYRIEWGLREYHHQFPFMVKYYGTSTCGTLDVPCPTIITNDHLEVITQVREAHARQSSVPSWMTPYPHLCEEYCAGHDLRKRYLTPHEALRVQGFPENYWLPSGKKTRMRLIGNAIPIQTGIALLTALWRYYQ